MITKEQASKLYIGQTVHSTGGYAMGSDCSREIGPRGGVKETVTRFRVSGAFRSLKTRDEWRVPVKHGMYGPSDEIAYYNHEQFHLPEDCPAGILF